MASTLKLFKALVGIALKTTFFLRWLFLLPFELFLQMVKRISTIGQPSTSSPILPCHSTSDFDSISSPKEIHHPKESPHSSDSNSNINITMANSPSLPSAIEPPGGQPLSSTAVSDPSQTPRIQDENCPLFDPSSSLTQAHAQAANSQLTDDFSRLNLNAASKSAVQAAAMKTTERGDVVSKDEAARAIPEQPSDSKASLCTSASTTFITTTAAVATVPGEVVQAPAVPLWHPVSQTSKLKDPPPVQQDGVVVKIETPEQAAERAMHSRFMREALDMARLALRTNETPVGCVLVYKNRVIARGMNATNITRNGTRHAELMAICALLSYQADWGTRSGPGETNNNISATKQPLADKTNQERLDDDDNETSSWGDVDPTKGHLYPYGQKLHPAPRVSPDIIKECTLYVTVEPCVMCASLLRQLGIKRVYFGAVNDKFGGTGGVFRIHKNSPRVPASAPITPAPHHPISRPVPEPRSVSTAELSEKDGGSENGNALESNSGDSVSGDSTSGDNKSREVKTYEIRNIPFVPTTLPGDGGNIEPGYEVEGGWGRDEAITLLRQFYVQENNRAPVPRKKEGRAARLAAMMERDGHAGGSMLDPSLLALINKDGNKESSDSNKENDNNQESTDRKENDPPIENSQEAVANTTDKAQLIEETSLPSTAAA